MSHRIHFERTLTEAELDAIIQGDDADFDEVQDKTVGNWRHGTEHQLVVRHFQSNTLYAIDYRTTPDGPAEGCIPSQPYRVREKTVIAYEAIPADEAIATLTGEPTT